MEVLFGLLVVEDGFEGLFEVFFDVGDFPVKAVVLEFDWEVFLLLFLAAEFPVFLLFDVGGSD